MPAPDDFQALWRERLASGSKLSSRALATALKEDASRLPLVAPLCADALPTVRVSALRVFEELSVTHGALVAPYAKEIVEGLAAPEPDAQASALAALANVAPHAPESAALALPLIADLLAAKRPAIREEAARCLGRLGSDVPQSAPLAADRLAHALAQARHARAATEAREILAAIEGLLPNLGGRERASLSAVVQPLRAHPNMQVRERAGRLARQLA